MIQLSISDSIHLALTLQRGGALAEAEMLYSRILDAAPASPDALHYLALLRHQQRRLEEAAQLIRRIIEIDPSNADAFNNLGNVYEGMKDDARAENCFRAAIELNPRHAPAHNNLGVLLAGQGQLDQAIQVYRKAVQFSPLSAEFHNNLGNALRRRGLTDEAIAAYRKTVEIEPDHFGALQGLARTLRLAGRLDEAVQVFDALLRMKPGDPVFSYLRSACLGENAPQRAPEAYVQQIFDDSAAYFDKHLEALDYRAPTLLMEQLVPLLPLFGASPEILDAGCGTGLCGPLLRPHSARLDGVDLSQGMLQQAALRQVYDDLYFGELTRFLESREEVYHVVVAADTLCYFGALEEVFRGAAGSLKAGGLLAFTAEDAGHGAQGVTLNSSGRYSHSRCYLEGALLDAGFCIDALSSAVLRNEGQHPVHGHLVVARKAPAGI